MTPDEDGTIPWRWRNLLHWQRAQSDHLFEIAWALNSIRMWLRTIAVLLSMLVVVVIL